MAGFDPDKYLQEKSVVKPQPSGFDPDAYLAEKLFTKKSDDSLINDVYVKTTEGLLFGARPFVAGVGGGIGGAIGQATRTDQGLAERIKGVPKAFQKYFSEARQGALSEEADVSQRRPGLSTGIGIGTALATAPLIAAKGVQTIGQAARIGSGLGAAQALGHAENSGEAIETIGKGALIGGAVQGGVNLAGKALPAIGRGMANGAQKTASALTGISEKEIQTYATRADQVKDLLKKSGGDMAEAADQIRNGLSRDIQIARQKLGNQIGQALDDPKYANALVDAKPVLSKLDEAISSVSKTTARFRPDEINELKNVRDLVSQSLDQTGKINLRTLSEIKEELQAIAKPSYNHGATIFPKGDLAAKASKGAAGEARRLLNAAAPEIKHANEQLSKLHRIEELMNKNLIREGKPESALISAGSGGNPRNAKLLGAIDQITGGRSVEQAENLAAARSFGNPQLLPADFTGKSAARILTGAGAGTVLGGPVGGAIGGALTSPAALKLSIDTGRFASRMAKATGQGIGRMLPQTPVGSGQAAMLSGGIQRTSGESPAAENVINRRLRFLDKGRNTKSGSGQ